MYSVKFGKDNFKKKMLFIYNIMRWKIISVKDNICINYK